MKKLFALLLILIAGTLLHKPVMAQSYPVQATVMLTSPYSVYLADYTSPGSNRIMVNVLLKDLTRFDLQARLKLTIEGVGVSITTKPTYRPQPLYLQGGLPVMLTEADLAPYFNPENLVFQGVSKNSILKGGALPEGLYRVCIEVLDYNLGAQVSNRACASAWMVLNDPPIINLPFQGEKVRAQYPQNVVFQWTPRHTGSPNAAFSTEYEFELVELWQPNINPNHAMLSSPPIYQTTTFSTTLIYGPAEPPLEPGRKYAFRVKAKAMAGIDQLDLFKNKGYSEVFTFTYGDACTTPSFISATSISSSRVHVSWHAEPVHSEFIVGYRKQGDDQWQEQNTYLTELIISELQPETVYEFRVRGVCGFVEGEDTEAVMSMTSEAPVTNFVCGAGPDAYSLDNQKPLSELKPGDIFRTTDIEVRVFDVQGGNGTFSGIGHVRVPWMKQASVRVEFNSIFINSDYQMLRGVVKTIFNPHSQTVVNLDSNDELSGDENNGDEASQDADIEITYDGEISNVQVNTETGEIIVTDEDGNQTTYEQEIDEETGEKKSVKITDSSGDIFLIDKDGNVTKGAANDGNSTPDEGSQQQFTIEEKIVIAVLEDFKTHMEAWLEVHGKGPLSDYEMMWAEGLPGCLPENAGFVDKVYGYVDELLESETKKKAFAAKVQQNNSFLSDIGQNISADTEVSEIERALGEENWQQASDATCEQLLTEDGITSQMIVMELEDCPDCNLWTMPNGQIFYASRADLVHNAEGKDLFDKLDVVYSITSGGKQYLWNAYLEAYYNKDGEKFENKASSWYDGMLLELGEVGRDMIDPETYKQQAIGVVKMGFAMAMGDQMGADLGIGLGPEDYKRLYAQMMEWEGQGWSRFFVKITWGAVTSYAGSFLMNSSKLRLFKVKKYTEAGIEIKIDQKGARAFTKEGEELGEVMEDGLIKDKATGEAFDPLSLPTGTKWFDDLPKGLRNDIGDLNSDLGRYIRRKGQAGVDAWAILKNRPQLRVKPEALEALNKVRKSTKLGDLKITDDMLSNIEGIPNVSYAQILDDLDVAIKALPEGKVVDFQRVIADGQRGLVNKNNVWDRRHSWLTLKKIKENETFLKNADEIKFEVELEQIDGISNAVPDIVVTKSGTGGTTKKIIGEVKAGDNVITTNFNSQSLRYFQEIADVRDLRLFRRDGVPLTKQQVIDSWKSGVTNNQKVRELFTDYYNRVNDADLDITFTQAQLENFLSTNDNWFDLIFNSSF